jgi:hypothetical protein
MAQILETHDDFLNALASVPRCPNYHSRAHDILLLKLMMLVVLPTMLATVCADLVREVVHVVSDRVLSKVVQAALHVLCRLCPWC